MYRVCKRFEIETAHILSKHPGNCRFPHGHSRTVEVVLSAQTLDENQMVCDFKALKLCVQSFLDRLDHALCVNSEDTRIGEMSALGERIVRFEGEDPTTEVLAREIFAHIDVTMHEDRSLAGENGVTYRIGSNACLERVRVWETSTSWAEYCR